MFAECSVFVCVNNVFKGKVNQKHMNSIHRDIFKAIHEGKWLKIEYLNKEGKHTNYWIGIRDLDPRNKTLKVDGLHLKRCSIEGYDKIYIDSILSTEIMDEASQCNVAISLVPIIRGEKLMLVGDPQQLKPVILLDELTNRKLRRKYHVADEYDYRENSIYKTYLACDAVSDEILLRNHYRCNEKIIDFNNKKYYNSKLQIQSDSAERQPLVYVNVDGGLSEIKNTSPAEVEEIMRYARENPDKSIAVITPFVNQRMLIEQGIKENGFEHVVCGTVHAFQGDEKDVVLFSTALSSRTGKGTYSILRMKWCRSGTDRKMRSARLTICRSSAWKTLMRDAIIISKRF